MRLRKKDVIFFSFVRTIHQNRRRQSGEHIVWRAILLHHSAPRFPHTLTHTHAKHPKWFSLFYAHHKMLWKFCNEFWTERDEVEKKNRINVIFAALPTSASQGINARCESIYLREMMSFRISSNLLRFFHRFFFSSLAFIRITYAWCITYMRILVNNKWIKSKSEMWCENEIPVLMRFDAKSEN